MEHILVIAVFAVIAIGAAALWAIVQELDRYK